MIVTLFQIGDKQDKVIKFINVFIIEVTANKQFVM
jgi:hypothetical protein